MKISLLHPSRGRPVKSFMNAMEWRDKSGIEDLEIICVVDSSDQTKEQYFRHYGSMCYETITNDVVAATNAAAKLSTGDILIYLSDDFMCFENWGLAVIQQFENENRPLVLKVDDCLQVFSTKIITIPMMNRALYEKLGYFFHPEYKSMFCDEHLYWVSHRIGAIKNCEHLKFQHEHHSIGKSKNDETYRRSEANWSQGKAVFQKHKAQGFPI